MTSAWGTSWGAAWAVSWDIAAPVPPTPSGGDGATYEVGDGFIRTGNLIRWFPRPKELEPDKAEALAVKKVAKRLGLSKQEAQNVVSLVQREVAQQVNYLRAAGMATSGLAGDKYTSEQISDMRGYWSAVVAYAIEIEEEDEIALLLS